MTTATEHRAKEAECLRAKEESWERSDTDGFLTQWANGITAKMHHLAAEIEEDGGRAVFWGLYDGDRRVKAKMKTVKDRYSYGTKLLWLLDDDEAETYGRKWIPTGGNSRVQKGLGLAEREEWAPARATVKGYGTGLSGNAWAAVERTDDWYDDWGMDAELVEDA